MRDILILRDVWKSAYSSIGIAEFEAACNRGPQFFLYSDFYLVKDVRPFGN